MSLVCNVLLASTKGRYAMWSDTRTLVTDLRKIEWCKLSRLAQANASRAPYASTDLSDYDNTLLYRVKRKLQYCMGLFQIRERAAR